MDHPSSQTGVSHSHSRLTQSRESPIAQFLSEQTRSHTQGAQKLGSGEPSEIPSPLEGRQYASEDVFSSVDVCPPVCPMPSWLTQHRCRTLGEKRSSPAFRLTGSFFSVAGESEDSSPCPSIPSRYTSRGCGATGPPEIDSSLNSTAPTVV